MSDVFGDVEPGDSWDPDDPTDVLLDNLCRRAESLVHHTVLIPRGNPIVTLHALDELVDRAEHRHLSDRDRLGFVGLAADIDTVRERVGWEPTI
jgi:hypothetical protein